jgi:hypothetical protein
MTAPDWQRQCILCARRGRTTRLETGHACAACAGWLAVQVANIARLAADAAAWLAPGSANGGSGRPVPGSRPPLRVDALMPELTVVPQDGQPSEVWPTVLEVLEAWCRMIRQERHMAPYGPASLAAARTTDGLYAGTSATLVGATTFLGRQVPWITTTTDFPVEDFVGEIVSCVKVLRKWDHANQADTAYVVDCPHGLDDGTTCGYRLRIMGDDVDSWFHCPRCRTEWSVDRLMLVWAETSDAAMWLDHEAVSRRYGVDRSTLDRWVRSGRISKWHGLYDVRPLALAQRRGA